MISFKRPEIAQELLTAPPMLRLMAHEFTRVSAELGVQAVITRILGRVDGDSGVHAAHRAIDFRDEYVTDVGPLFLYTIEQRQKLLAHVALLFPRTDGIDSIKHHSFNGAPYHFHLQVGVNPSAYKSMLFPKGHPGAS